MKVILLLIGLSMTACAPALYVPQSTNSKEASDLQVLNEGRALYVRNCGSCHSLYIPNDFSEEAWEAYIEKMQNRAKISDSEKALILQYLTSYKPE